MHWHPCLQSLFERYIWVRGMYNVGSSVDLHVFVDLSHGWWVRWRDAKDERAVDMCVSWILLSAQKVDGFTRSLYDIHHPFSPGLLCLLLSFFYLYMIQLDMSLQCQNTSVSWQSRRALPDVYVIVITRCRIFVFPAEASSSYLFAQSSQSKVHQRWLDIHTHCEPWVFVSCVYCFSRSHVNFWDLGHAQRGSPSCTSSSRTSLFFLLVIVRNAISVPIP